MAVYQNFDISYLKDIKGVSYIGRPKNNTMMYLTKKIEKEIYHLSGVSGCLAFVETGVVIPESAEKNNVIIVCNDPPSKYTEVALLLEAKIETENKLKKYTLETGGYFIGEGVSIGENTTIEPGAFIDHEVMLGDNVLVKAGAKIRRNTVIGNKCVIGENTVIGEPAFNVAKQGEYCTVLIPSFGGVIIGNNVSIGANCAISRGGADNTVIEDSVKIDSNVRVAHDAHLHKCAEVCGRSGVAGYTEVGEYSVVSSGCNLKNRIKIGKRSFIGMGSFVNHDIKDNMTVTGNPARSLESVAKKRVFEGKLRSLLRKLENNN